MAFLFDDSLIPSGPSSMLKHHDLMPTKQARAQDSSSMQPRQVHQDCHAFRGEQAKWPPNLQGKVAPSRISGRQRGHGRSGSVDSCIGTVVPVDGPKTLARGGSKAGPAVTRHGSQPQVRAAGNVKGHSRRHSADVTQVGAVFDPRRLGSSNQYNPAPPNESKTRKDPRVSPPFRKHTAPPSFPAIPIKRSSPAGAAAPSLPMPRRKGSAGRPSPAAVKAQVAGASLSRSMGLSPPKPLQPIQASLPQASNPIQANPGSSLHIPFNSSSRSLTPRSGSYTSTFTSSPCPYTAGTPLSGSSCPDTAGTSSSSDSAASSDTSATARPGIPAADLLEMPDLPKEFSARLSHLVPAQRRVGDAIPAGMVHVPSLLLALGYVLEILVFERAQLKSPSPSSVNQPSSPMSSSGVPPPLSARRTLLCSHTHSLLWRLISQHLASLSTLLVPLLEALQGATYSRQVERCMEGARAYILKIRKVFAEVVALYAEQYSFVQGWWEDKWIKEAATEIGAWCEVLGA